MNDIVKGSGQKKSEIKKDIEYFYGIDFVHNYEQFKKGNLCLRNDNFIKYVDNNKYMFYDINNNILIEEFDKCLVRIFFEHDDGYEKKNISNEIENVKRDLKSGKDWNGYRYRDEKYYLVSQSNYFSGWFTEEETTENEVMKEVIKSINFDKEDVDFPPLVINGHIST